MENKIIVFANQKGGVGKTTICTLFANYLAQKNKDVLVIDADLQKSIFTQREMDVQAYEDEEPPYLVQAISVDDVDTVQTVMDSASQMPGWVLFDAPGNISQDGLVSLFTNADAIICPYMYDTRTLNSTGVFIKVMDQLKALYPEMKAQLFFVPNRIDNRVGKRAEIDMWKSTDTLLNIHGKVCPIIPNRVSLSRADTYTLSKEDSQIVKKTFDYILKNLK